jgi:hypothetical protein
LLDNMNKLLKILENKDYKFAGVGIFADIQDVYRT